MKRIAMFMYLILTIHQICCQTGNDNCYYAEGRRHYFSTDSTSVNIIVSNIQHYDTIALSLCAFYSDSTEYSVFFSNEDDNIVVSSKSTLLRNVDSLLNQIVPNNGDIAFISYSKQIGTQHIWLRNEVYVKFKDSLQALSSLASILPHYAINQIVYEGENEYKLVINDENQLLQISNELYDTSKVIYATPDFYGEIVLNTSDEYFDDQWGLHNTGQNGGQEGCDIKAELAWEFLNDYFGNSQYPTIRVAVIDDGIEDHEDLYDANGLSKVVSGFTPGHPLNHGAPLPKSKHGECCAGIIGASHNSIGIAGVAENVQIIPIRIFKKKNDDSELITFSYAKIAKGIKKAWSDLEADVLSNSWGSTDVYSPNDKLNSAISDALIRGRDGKGSVVVFASGNNDKSQVNYPANQSGVIAVGGIERCGFRAGNNISSYMCEPWEQEEGSCYGNALSVVAPGTKIWTIDRQGSGYGYDNAKYYLFSGTSAACPFVSGLSALMLSVNPLLTQAEIHSIINRTATKIPHYDFYIRNNHPDGTWNESVGYGLINAHKAVCEARLHNRSFAIQGESVVNVCENYTYSLTGIVPPEFDIVWETSPFMSIIDGQGTAQIVVKPISVANGNWVIAHICHRGEVIRTIGDVSDYIISQGYGYVNIIQSDSTLSSNAAWALDGALSHTITIDSLVTLTITGNVFCTSNARIIVRPGGKLVVNGGTLTSACDGEMWQGIIVEGHNNIRQAALAQGSVILNNATIENAWTAISTRGADTNAIYEHTGGIVQATNTLFSNNRRSVEFLSYENHTTTHQVTDNASYFTRCTFTVDDDNLFVAQGRNFQNHVTMWQVRGVKFNGCSFHNEMTGTSHRGKAVSSIEAGFNAKRVCPTISDTDPCVCENHGSDTVTRCSFVGFDTAVHTSSTLGNYDITLDNCDFAQNLKGGLLSVADNDRISFCDFNLDHPSSVVSGIVLQNSTGYTIEGNSFHRTSTKQAGTGICFDNSGSADNVARLNDFTKLQYGCRALNSNANNKVRVPTGLQFFCNSFSRNQYDISVSTNASIRRIQGSATAGADNDFDHTLTNSLTIPSTHDPVTYYRSSGGNHQPIGSSSYYTVRNATANGCASTICGSHVGPYDPIVHGLNGGALPQYQSMAEQLSQMQEQYENIQDLESEEAVALQSEMSDLSAAMSELARTEIRGIISDSVPDLALLKDWYKAINTPLTHYLMAEAQSTEGLWDKARATLEDIPVRFELDDSEKDEYTQYGSLQSLREAVYGNWYKLSDSQIAQMQQVAESGNGRAARMAKEILCFFHHICYEGEPFPDEMDQTAFGTRGLAVGRTDSDNALTLSPNPANSTVTLQLSDPQDEIRQITVANMQGQVMLSQTVNATTPYTLDISALPAGIYAVRVLTANGQTLTGKMVKFG